MSNIQKNVAKPYQYSGSVPQQYATSHKLKGLTWGLSEGMKGVDWQEKSVGKLIPLEFARAARRGIIIDARARMLFSNLQTVLCNKISYRLISGNDLGLTWAPYSEIVFVAKKHGLVLCPPEFAIPLASSGPPFPIVLVGMFPKYKNGTGYLVRVSNMRQAAYVDVESFNASKPFSPYVVFAFSNAQ